MHSSIGTTISDAVSKLSQEVPQRVSFTHVTTVLLSEELISSIGFRPVVDFFERNQEMRRNIWVCITKKGKFHEVISVYTPCGFVTAAEMIGSIIDFRKNNLFSTTSRMGDFVEILGHQGQETYTQGITTKTPVFHTTEPKYRLTRTDGIESPGTQDIIIADTAVFRDDKMVGWMNESESRGLLWVKGEIKGGILTTSFEDKKISMRIVRVKSKVKPIIEDEKMSINITVDVKTSIAESQADLDFTKTEVIEKIEDLQNEEVKREILMALEKSIELSTDVFWFGNYFYRKYPKHWKSVKDNWYDYYPGIDVNIKVTSTIQCIGLITRPIEKSQGDS